MKIDITHKDYKVVTAESGCYLFNGETFSEQIFTPHSLDLSKWQEVTEDYKAQWEKEHQPKEAEL